MRAVVQRVSQARVCIGDKCQEIREGFVVFLGITHQDTQVEADWMVKKLLSLRIFSDKNQKMNLSLEDIKGEMLLVSQFTLYAATKKGNRPSFIGAAPAQKSKPLYQYCVTRLSDYIQDRLKIGEFGASMQVSLVNEGPVTILLDSLVD